MDPGYFYGQKKVIQTGLAARINNIWDASAKPGKNGHAGRHIAPLRPFTASLLGPAVVWKTFFRQAEALEYRQSEKGSDLHVFAFESLSLSEGRRRYLVTSYEHFWHTYKQIDAEEKHHYEVITEERPVKLYFDLEFSREFNPGRDGEDMVDFFLRELEIQFQEIYSRPFPCADKVQMDASTVTKFSQHIIFPSAVFENVFHAGHFVRHFCQTLLCASPSPDTPTDTERAQIFKKFLVKNKDGTESLFVDQGVYTKNRNFRLYKSCKLGKTNPLLLTMDCALQEKPDRTIFFLSLICNVPSDSDRSSFLQFDCEKHPLPGHSSVKSIQRRPGVQGNPSVPGETGSAGSPYPQLDRFFESIITAGGQQGKIRQWQYFPDTQTLVYSICGDYKYCERIGRHHKSNNIIFVAFLRAGTYHQKCMDADCRAVDFRSRDYCLPVRLVDLPSTEVSPAMSGVGNASGEENVSHDEFYDQAGDEFLASVPLDF